MSNFHSRNKTVIVSLCNKKQATSDDNYHLCCLTLPATSLWLDPILLAEVRHRAAKRECEARMRRLRMEMFNVEDEKVKGERWRDGG